MGSFNHPREVLGSRKCAQNDEVLKKVETLAKIKAHLTSSKALRLREEISSEASLSGEQKSYVKPSIPEPPILREGENYVKFSFPELGRLVEPKFS